MVAELKPFWILLQREKK